MKRSTITLPEDLESQGVFTLHEAVAAGVSQPTLSRMVSRGEVQRGDRGVYYTNRLVVEDVNEITYRSALKLFPESYIGGLSALNHYELLDASPRQLWLVTPITSRTSNRNYRLIRTNNDRHKGIIESDGFRIASAERAIIDSFKYLRIWGVGIPIKSARLAYERGFITEETLFALSKELGWEKLYMKYWPIIEPQGYAG